MLCDPSLTGHSVWSRTRHGRPVPPAQWVVSRRRTHQAILDTPLWQITRRAVTGELLALVDGTRDDHPTRTDNARAGDPAGAPWWTR